MKIGRVVQLVFTLIILYCATSINVLLLALGILPNLPGAYSQSFALMAFAVISFVTTLFVSAYHLSSMLRKRKRKSDRPLEKGQV